MSVHAELLDKLFGSGVDWTTLTPRPDGIALVTEIRVLLNEEEAALITALREKVRAA